MQGESPSWQMGKNLVEVWPIADVDSKCTISLIGWISRRFIPRHDYAKDRPPVAFKSFTR